MYGGRLSAIKIALNKIWHRRFRSACIALSVTVATLLITVGTLLGCGLRSGVESVNARLGADAMVAPQSAENNFEAALPGGYPSTFYLARDTAKRILQIDGILRAIGATRL
jgi:putative ABC transport system permease protein